MSFLSRAFETIFSSPAKLQLKAAFQQAAQAVRSNDTPTLKTILGNTKFDQDKNQSLLIEAIGVDNLEGFETVMNMAGISVSQRVQLDHRSPLTVQSLDTPMLPYAISRGSEKISRFLATHPDTNLQARARLSVFNSCVCPATGTVYVHTSSASLRDAGSVAQKAGMRDVAEIIGARLQIK